MVLTAQRRCSAAYARVPLFTYSYQACTASKQVVLLDLMAITATHTQLVVARAYVAHVTHKVPIEDTQLACRFFFPGLFC